MKSKLRFIIILFFILIIIFLSNDNYRNVEKAVVKRVIDGDTMVLNDGTKVRLLGINTPEKGELFYVEAKSFLKNLEGKEVELEYILKNKDRYGRKLRYVFYNGFVNKQILEKGLAHYYSYSTDKYSALLKKAEKQARKNNLGIWKKSNKYGCIKIQKMKYKEKKECINEEQIIFYNTCSKFNATLKDKATHIYKIQIPDGRYAMNFSCVWNNNGDAVFIWDKDGLVLYYEY